MFIVEGFGSFCILLFSTVLVGIFNINIMFSICQWDPMITTLPGLYFASLPLLYPVSLMFYRGNMHSVCTTSLLRSVNVLFALGNLYLLYLISRKLHYNGKVQFFAFLIKKMLVIYTVDLRKCTKHWLQLQGEKNEVTIR